MPQRRKVIGTILGASLSLTTGCISSNNDTNTTTPDTTSTRTKTTSQTSEMEGTTGDRPISKDDLVLSGEIINKGEMAPPKISLSLTNKGSQKIILSSQTTPPFSSYWADGNSDLVLLPDYREYIRPSSPGVSESNEGCWKLDQGIKVESISVAASLRPGDSLNEKYTVVNNASVEACDEDGRYSFSDELDLDNLRLTAGVNVHFSRNIITSISTKLE